MSDPNRRPVTWFNARNVTIFVVSMMSVATVWSVIAQWIPPSPYAPAFDSYSGTVIGYRGVHDLLAALGRPVRRNTEPPPAWLHTRDRVVLLQPSILAIELEKDYLKQLQGWVLGGGEVVLVSEDLSPDAVRRALPDGDDARTQRILEFFGENRLLKSLGIEDLTVSGAEQGLEYFREESDDWRHIMTNLYADYRPLDTTCHVSATGTLAELESLAPTVQLPRDTLRYFEGGSIEKAAGSLSVVSARGGTQSKPIALDYEIGGGCVTVIAEPALVTNASLAVASNAVVAYHLIAGPGDRPVLIDEYYHGSLSGSSALHVLTFRPFPVVALIILAAVLVWAWSHLVRFGPPQPTEETNRRRTLEYVDAMARLYRRGRKEAFVLKSLRDGALERLREDVHLPSGIPEHQLVRWLAQRDSDAAQELATLLDTIDALLASGAGIPKPQLLDLQGKLESCRWKNTPPANRPALPMAQTTA